MTFRWGGRWNTWTILLCSLAAAGAVLSKSAEAPVRKLGVVAFYNPRLMYLKYQPLVDYLTSCTRSRWELAISSGYSQTVEGLCNGSIDVAYLGPLTYVIAAERCGARPVVRLRSGEDRFYRSVILVREDSDITSLDQIRGKVFAFGSPLSTSSHLVPRAMLADAGLQAGKDFQCSYYGHHERAARAVLLGKADACGVRDLVAARFEGKGLRAIARSDPIPNFPFVVSPYATDELAELLVDVLVTRPRKNPDVAALMSRWDPELASGFARCKAEDYKPVKELLIRMFGKKALSLDEEIYKCSGNTDA